MLSIAGNGSDLSRDRQRGSRCRDDSLPSACVRSAIPTPVVFVLVFGVDVGGVRGAGVRGAGVRGSGGGSSTGELLYALVQATTAHDSTVLSPGEREAGAMLAHTGARMWAHRCGSGIHTPNSVADGIVEDGVSSQSADLASADGAPRYFSLAVEWSVTLVANRARRGDRLYARGA